MGAGASQASNARVQVAGVGCAQLACKRTHALRPRRRHRRSCKKTNNASCARKGAGASQASNTRVQVAGVGCAQLACKRTHALRPRRRHRRSSEKKNNNMHALQRQALQRAP